MHLILEQLIPRLLNESGINYNFLSDLLIWKVICFENN